MGARRANQALLRLLENGISSVSGSPRWIKPVSGPAQLGLLKFQEAAVQIAAHHVNKRGGVVVGDVVGLGKTLVGTAIAHVCEEDFGVSTLIICPKNLVKMWQGYVERYGLRGKVMSISRVIKELPDVPATPEPPKTKDVTPTPTKSTPTEQPQSSTVTIPVYESDQQEVLPSMPLTFSAAYEAPVNPYPEDTAPVGREAASLKLPTRRFRSKTIARGPIIGVEKATSLQDIALVRTLLEAAKFQSIRQKSVENSNNGLILSPKDLHSYRRAPVAEQMLMLVLDHTCLEDCKWQDALLPYLSWAYVERASICLIQVGAADACHELQAEKVMAQSILTPRISAGIEAKGGKATPLAHGLDLALQTLRHALQHGRSTVQQVILVVISDGRGNVPLEASRFNRKPQSVKRQGIEDALNIAKSIASLDNVQTVLLNPQSKAYPELPLELAKVLGAKVVLIPLQETWELEQ